MYATTPRSYQSLHVLRDVDAHQLAKSITGWDQTYTQTASGRFHGELTELLLGAVQIFTEKSSHALQQTCKISPQSIWFGIPEKGTQIGKINGSPICENMLAVHTGESDFRLSTPNNFVFFGIVIELEALRFWLAHNEDTEIPKNGLEQRVLWTEGSGIQLLQSQLRQIFQFANASAELTLNAKQAIVEDLMDLLSQALVSRKSLPRDSVASQCARKMVRRVQDYIQTNDDRSVTVHELCIELGTSRRALQDCFRKSMGIGPKAYLHAYRLNAVKRELHREDSNYKTVGDAAARFGFWHLSQFTADYKRLFNELPSTSLRQRNCLKSIRS